MASKSWRRVHIDGREWLYRIGRSNAVILSPTGQKHVAQLTQIAGATWDQIERAAWKCYITGWFNPSRVKRYIVEELLGRKPHDLSCAIIALANLVHEKRPRTH